MMMAVYKIWMQARFWPRLALFAFIVAEFLGGFGHWCRAPWLVLVGRLILGLVLVFSLLWWGWWLQVFTLGFAGRIRLGRFAWLSWLQSTTRFRGATRMASWRHRLPVSQQPWRHRFWLKSFNATLGSNEW